MSEEGTIYIIRANGTIEVQKATKPPELEELQAWVGGWIELLAAATVYQGQPAQMFVNEEGKLKQLPFNVRATAASGIKGWGMPGDYIAGDMVILTGAALTD